LVELLTLVEIGKERLRHGQPGKTELGDTVRNAWRIYEMILRDTIHKYPAELSRSGPDSARPTWQRIGLACQRLDMPFLQHKEVSFVTEGRIRKALQNPGGANTPELLAAAVFSAVGSPPPEGVHHPVRILAAHRPHLLTDLTHLSGDRNVGSHGKPVEINREFAELAWQLAQEAVAAFLNLPLPKTD